MMQYAVISNGSADAAVVVHDTDSARVVFKGDPASDIYRAFCHAYGRAVVIPIANGRAMLRRKVIPTQEEYLLALLGKCVHHPYEIRTIQPAESYYRLDPLADKLSKEILEA